MHAKKNIALIVLLAWRNVWKNKRRTVLTMLTILAGCVMIVSMNSLGLGGHDQMIEDAVSVNTGHIQIHEKGFWENHSLEYAFKVTPGLISTLESLKKTKIIHEYSKRIVAGGLLSYKTTTSGSIILGIEPGKEKNVTTLSKKLKAGRFINADDTNEVVIGVTLAKNIGATLGSKIAMLSQGFDGSIAGEYLTVVGFFESGNPEYDQMLVLMSYQQAKKTFSMMGYVNSIVIRLDDIGHSGKVKKEISSLLSVTEKNCKKEAGGQTPKCTSYEVMGWSELIPELVQWIAMDDFSLYVFDFILFMIVAFGILNTIQMSVFERTRELGIMLAIGTTPGQVKAMILVESFFMTVTGVVLGVALGAVVSIYFKNNPLDFTEYAKEMAAFQMNTVVMPAKLSMTNIIVTSLLTMVLSFVFTLFPARRAANLEPIEAIRHL